MCVCVCGTGGGGGGQTSYGVSSIIKAVSWADSKHRAV